MIHFPISDIKQTPNAIPAQTTVPGRPVWMNEDKEFKESNPVVYQKIASRLKEKRVFREYRINNITSKISTILSDAGFEPRISGRPKHIYSIYKKMCQQHLTFEGIQDLNGLRIILKKVEDCYRVLNIIHRLWSPIPCSFDDYIASPKKSGYQSLHTTLTSGHEIPLEIQVRTTDMHWEAEYGQAAHWRYKLNFHN